MGRRQNYLDPKSARQKSSDLSLLGEGESYDSCEAQTMRVPCEAVLANFVSLFKVPS